MDLPTNFKKFSISSSNIIYYIYDYTPRNRKEEKQVCDQHIMNIKDTIEHFGDNKWKNDKRNESIAHFKAILLTLFGSKPNIENAVLCLVPGHSKNSFNPNMKEIIANLCEILGIENGSKILSRFKEVSEAHKTKGIVRNKDTHLESIRITDSKLISGKNIILLDDVTTSGSSLLACKEILMRNGATKVDCVALGKTSINHLEY